MWYMLVVVAAAAVVVMVVSSSSSSSQSVWDFDSAESVRYNLKEIFIIAMFVLNFCNLCRIYDHAL